MLARLSIGALGAAIVLLVTVGVASASRLEVPLQSFATVWSEEKTWIMPIDIECRMTVEGSFHSKTFAKVSGTLVGSITRATFPADCPAKVRAESLPWHLRYERFLGELPKITGVLLQVINLRIEIMPCIYTSVASSPAKLRLELTGGTVTGMQWVEVQIPRSAGEEVFCPNREVTLLRRGEAKVLGGTDNIEVKLIGAGNPKCPRTIVGEGSSVQQLAQTAWTEIFSASCEGAGSASFRGSESAAGLSAWHAEGRAGSITESEDQFVATTEAPESGEVTNIREHAGRAGVAVIPVAQAAVAVIVHRPSGCEIRKIDNESLEKIWDHAVTNWERISPRPTGTCNATIRRVVRRDRSGSTYQFKHYLFLINKLRSISGKTWEGLQESAENVNWPERATDLVIPSSTGVGALVSEVEATANSVGYADLGDALGRTNVTLIEVQNGTEAEGFSTYARPQEAGSAANCGAARYREGPNLEVEISRPTLSQIWRRVYGSNPNIGGSAYSICTLTWMVVVLNYATAGWEAEIGKTVREYLTYVLGSSAQSQAEERNYNRPPTSILEAARTIAEGIS